MFLVRKYINKCRNSHYKEVCKELLITLDEEMNYMLKRILFVDDEAQILRSITRLFMDTEYDILTAESGAEALDILEIEQVDVIVSDMKMPKMTGYELLSQVKRKFPDIVRIILSGFSDERIVFDALQKNIAKLYILKPHFSSIF